MTNRLAQELSPYLRQHKNNPVDWMPWGPEALAKAKTENKPILLSVGYAACHWCHVMAHESFEDDETAALMNAEFVNIKVDREQRPDLDSIYQTALSLMGQQGGWPLTMFLSADGKPFAGGTYFPKTAQYGRPSFKDLLQKIAEIYRSEPKKVQHSQSAIMERLTPVLNPKVEGELSATALSAMAEPIVRTVDPNFGGFGGAPKFPNTPLLELLWRAHLSTGNESYRKAVELSLTQMCQGGIYDHLGGGFARYSVDEEWLVPHFEKMLYDNAQLISLLTLVWQFTQSPLFKQRVEETVDWAMREMWVKAPNGGHAFAASLDADSEGEEGLFYVWSKGEIDAILGTEDSESFCSVYGVSEAGNFEGKNILNFSNNSENNEKAHSKNMHEMRVKLIQHREQRVRPGLDDKILADWNGLMIAALAKAGAAFERADWIGFAAEAFKTVIDIPAKAGDGLAEDHANLLKASLALTEATANPAWLEAAMPRLEKLETSFTAEGGGFYQSGKTATDVIVRSCTIYDNAVPPANATMLEVCARLYQKTGEQKFRAAGDAIIQRFAGVGLKVPQGTASFLNAFALWLNPLHIVVVNPEPSEIENALTQTAQKCADPNAIISSIAGHTNFPIGHTLHGKAPIEGKPTAYVCRGTVCSAPVTESSALEKLLKPGATL